MTRKNEAGQALVFGVLALSLLLMGFAGLGIDMGYLRYEKRLQQSAADSAAIAGAGELLAVSGGVPAVAAQNAAAASGFTAASTNTGCPPAAPAAAVGSVSVTVNNPPCSGPHASGKNPGNYVEVYVAKRQPVFFMSILGVKPQVVTARAVATAHGGNVPYGCMYTLGAPPNNGVGIQGSADIEAKSCGIVDNGDFFPTGKSPNLILNAGTFGIAGQCVGSGCPAPPNTKCWNQPGPCPATGEPAAGNPMLSLAFPTVGTPTTFNASNIPTNCNPCTYSGIHLSGSGTVVFPPGTYVLDGGDFTCTGTPGISGTGVTFYFYNATFTCKGNDAINLSAPSSGPNAGTLFYQDSCPPASTCTGPSLGGNTGSNFLGVLYFPSSTVTFFGNSTGTNVGIVVADGFDAQGNPTINLEGAAGLGSGVTVIENAVLVE
jgi:Flp pilus assembly protein TadG